MESPRQNFRLQFSNFRKTPGKLEVRFRIYASCYVRGDVQYRKYKHGVQLISVGANGRARLHMYADMRVYIYNNGRSLGWETEHVDFEYSDAVVDRVGHVGGYAARVMGDAFVGAVKQWFPAKEREAVAAVKRAISDTLRGSRPVRNDVARLIQSL